MSAPILFPGDRIHLTMPACTDRHGDHDLAATEKLARSFIDMYAVQDVTVFGWSANRLFTAVTVVAVFRSAS